MVMNAARLHDIGDFRCDKVEIPVPHGSELLLKVGACGVCGSDLPRVFVHGSSNQKYPLTIGHEFSGEVVAVGETADPRLIGTKGAVYPLIPCRKCDACVTGNYAMCEDYDYLGSRRDGGFAEYCLIPSQWHLIKSTTASMEALAMTEPACVAQHAVRRTGISAGQFLVIYGAGPIGILCARWAKIFGAEVLLVDIAADKISFAKRKGFEAVMSNVAEEVRKRNRNRLADAAIEGTGTGSALAGCVECVRTKGSITMLGNPSCDTMLTQKTHSMILRKELNLHGIWNNSRAPYPINEWAYTVHMLDEGKLEVTDLITNRLSIEEIPEVIFELQDHSRQAVKVMFVNQ